MPARPSKPPAPPARPTKSKGGRPPKYRPEFAQQAHQLCLLGATDVDMAEFFSVTEVTINLWKKAHPEFAQALREGKTAADARVAQSLYQRAIGYEHKAVKIFSEKGVSFEHQYTERFPPDVTAARLWLTNRQPARWRDKQEHAHSGDVEVHVRRTILEETPPP